MKPKQPTQQRKGIAFGGCSFTWGQGLHYYSNLSTLILPENENMYDEELVSYAHFKFIETVRYPRLVAQHFNTFELVQPFNGGATRTTVDFWTAAINSEKNSFSKINWNVPSCDISTFVCQLTQWSRMQVTIEVGGEVIGPVQVMDLVSDRRFSEWLTVSGTTFDEVLSKFRAADLSSIKTFLEEQENKGIRVVIVSWPDDLVNLIKSDDWLSRRFVNLKYKGATVGSIEALLDLHNLKISADFEFFSEPPKDHHPSLECHKIIAENIISFLESSYE